MTSAPSITIATFTFFEAVRNKLFISSIVFLLCLFGLAEFIGELAITETRQLQAAIMGSLLRLYAVFTVSLFVITSMVREFNDKGFELALSLSIKRGSYFLGKLLGYSLLAFIFAVMVSVPLVLYTDMQQLFIWMLSLFCELLIMISMSLLCLFTFGNITISFSIVMAFYLLSRTMNTIILVSNSPILETGTLAQETIRTMVETIAAILPDLDLFTQGSWLVYGEADFTALYPVAGQTLIYLVLLSAAALFDLYRKNL